MNPAAPTVDSHAHFWEPAAAGETAVGGALSCAALLTRMDDAGVDKLIQVTRAASGFDNTASLDGARHHADRVRVLARFDPAADDAPVALADLVADPLVAGVRLYHDPRVRRDWLRDDVLDRFWAHAEQLGVAVSLFAPGQERALARIAERHPALSIVIDHMGLAVFDWLSASERVAHFEATMTLAKHPNLALKLSGAPEATDEDTPFPRALELAAHALSVWTPARVMWGSNHPPSQRVGSYAQMVSFAHDVCAGLAQTERADVLGGTATRVFGLRW